MGTVLNISGTSPLDTRPVLDTREFFKPPFQAVGSYLTISLLKDAAAHFELPPAAEDPQLELFK